MHAIERRARPVGRLAPGDREALAHRHGNVLEGGERVEERRVLEDHLAAPAHGAQAFVGSQNLSATSLDLNRELGIIVKDPVSLARLTRTFEIDFRAATPQETP